MGNVEALNPKGFSQCFQFCLGYDTGTCLIAVRWAKPTNAQNPALAFQLEIKVLTPSTTATERRPYNLWCTFNSFCSRALAHHAGIPRQSLIPQPQHGPIPSASSEQPAQPQGFCWWQSQTVPAVLCSHADAKPLCRKHSEPTQSFACRASCLPNSST